MQDLGGDDGAARCPSMFEAEFRSAIDLAWYTAGQMMQLDQRICFEHRAVGMAGCFQTMLHIVCGV